MQESGVDHLVLKSACLLRVTLLLGTARTIAPEHATRARFHRALLSLLQSALANSRDPYRGHRGVQLFASIVVEHFDPELEALDGIPSYVFFNKIRVHVPPCRFTQSRARHAN